MADEQIQKVPGAIKLSSLLSGVRMILSTILITIVWTTHTHWSVCLTLTFLSAASEASSFVVSRVNGETRAIIAALQRAGI